ncbi:hypothetical protein FJT64_016448 [Amphibalanus amphitrite]|uniref:Uncharacterized protein n=1 Tax=Amphibalanus amphitrite TaxID=1232801 RepID=A0A6A4XCJ8_AMPAM|nr:hypothetical protein FJT64_016448 [Amphibalanus amphitrite]
MNAVRDLMLSFDAVFFCLLLLACLLALGFYLRKPESTAGEYIEVVTQPTGDVYEL